ncbi:hypothetical protein LCGC14_1527440 [marine sediment metagenome]|uniref:Uncharacterized protein n=1 Tax=marine sediment metagenome TaxID=412755 RepID=A0A0F9LCG1_9ZZZZ
MKKIKTKIIRIYTAHGHQGETYEPDRDIPYMFDVYEDDNGKQWEVNIGMAHDVEDKDFENKWIDEVHTG